MSFSSLANILNSQVHQKGLAPQIVATLVCEEFDKIVTEKWGDKMQNKVKALYLKNKILTIASLSTVFAQEIRLHETEIIKKINDQFPYTIERIRYLA
ncbi:MAG TPA: DciA family protein [bacterium]|nr:DciA family protein [bacterium]HPL95794.1 DciA family protein [bacterium]